MGNCLNQGHSPVGVKVSSEALILVVGNDSKFKFSFARDLAEARGATEAQQNRAGVRFFTRKSAPQQPQVVDTAPLRTVEDWSRIDTARVWVSQNSLRQRSGQVVFVVCVIDSPGPQDKIYEEHNFARNQFSWLHVLACVFEKNRKEIMILVNSEGSPGDASEQKLRKVLKRDGFKWQENIVFVRPSKTGGSGYSRVIKTILECSRDRGEPKDLTTSFSSFRLPSVEWVTAGDQGKFGPWGPENVLLFGMSGSGKSTLANMLTLGRLDGAEDKFSTSSSVRGETKKVSDGQGRGWRVIDTPGLGESNENELSGVSTDRAGKLIKEYVMLVQGVYCHFIYLWKIGRVLEADTILWDLFKKMFIGEGIENHMTIVVSGADKAWLDDNLDHLKRCFEGCDSFVAADFPAVEPDDDQGTETELQNIRLQSLKELEEYFASLCRLDSSCRLGMWSIITQRSMLARDDDQSIKIGVHMRQAESFGQSSGPPQPSDYETARTYIRMKAITTKTCLPGKKLELVPCK